MIASDFTEVVLIDKAITNLQSELMTLYERRKSIINPTTPTTRPSRSNKIDFDSIDLSISDHRPLSLGKSVRRGTALTRG